MKQRSAKSGQFLRSLGLHDRLYLMFSAVSSAALLLMLAVSIVMRQPLANILGLLGALLLFAGVTWVCVKLNRISVGANLVSALLIFAVMPFSYVNSGGIRGGYSLWFLFCVVYITMTVKGKLRYFYHAASVLTAGILYYREYTEPDFVSGIGSDAEMFLANMISLVLLGILISVMISYSIRAYREESRLANEQKKEIDELNKAQNRFFSSMSHEIRTPINTIIGLNEMILREDISDEVAEDADNIRAASKMLLNLINDILDMSKFESGQMKITPVEYGIGDMLSDIVGMLWIRAKEKGLEFHIDVDPELPSRFIGDEVRIKQILINLLTNAVKYTKEGSVTLSVQFTQKGPGSALLTFSVSDTGMGIKKESIPHLFSAFRRVDEEKNRYIEGTGLGLSIVKQFVELMGGTIKVNSVYTQGSTFVIELPQEIADERAVGNMNIEARHTMNHRVSYTAEFEAPEARVLAVDDNEANLLVVRKLLRDTKVQLDTAVSGREALARTLNTDYHVILMDHMMPEMDGIECLHQIRSQAGGSSRAAKIIALTANAGSDNQALYRREGFDGYLLKPVSGNQLETALMRALPADLVHASDGTLAAAAASASDIRTQRQRIPLIISTESVCELPPAMLRDLHISVLPHSVRTAAGIFADGTEAESGNLLFSYMDQEDNPVEAVTPSARDCEAYFARLLNSANRVVHIAMSSRIGKNGYAPAAEAARIFDNVTVTDSGQILTGIGILAVRAAEMAQRGASAEQITDAVEHYKTLVHTSFMIGTMEYMGRSGVISPMMSKFAGALMMHPILRVRNGRVYTGSISFGSLKRVREKYIRSVLKQVRRLNATGHKADLSRIYMLYADLPQAELKEVQEQLLAESGFREVICQKVSPSVAAGCGPGTFGLTFAEKSEE